MSEAAKTTGTAITPIAEVRNNLVRMQPQFKMALPDDISPERFIRIIITAVQNKPELLACERQSLYSAAMLAAQDGLLPDSREAVMLPYNVKVSKNPDRWANVVQYQPMVEGLIKKVRNSGEVGNISVQVVKENDEFTYELGDDEKIVHKPARSNRGKTIGAYSIVSLRGGEKSREFMDIEQLESVRKRSKFPDGGPWKTDTDEMYRKTVFRRHYKRLPKSTDKDGRIETTLKNDNATFDLGDGEDILDTASTVTEVKDTTAETKRPGALQAVVDQGGQSAAPTGSIKQAEPVQAQQGAAGKPPSDVI